MPEFETIREIARQALTASSPSGNEDNWLWDRTLRILRNVEIICRLPELARQAISIDRYCLIAAAYFSETGTVQGSAAPGGWVPSNPADGNRIDLCNLSAKVVTKKLNGVISDSRIEKTVTIIQESSDRFTEMTEAMILSDARNLEDMGIVGLLYEFRRNMILGKGVSDLLESWKCKIEYGYWQARIKESFRFDALRQIAQQRLAFAATLMDHLAAENDVCDLEEIVTQTLEKTR